ncbi:hypothetical protein [Fodinibius sediminis]|uniref:Uncharacterized protein n=1 Tax=Fodinibius sediminis TaxID=1214077 RepID=A0A521BKZ1_9BACT|nr:hypothetical protein [Fodinibius sediminis]SMO47756.1 hypothetical protein SAMN06265218_103200 [Fodinibius sediminis]
MKKIYSVILLWSFLIGALQPVLPMIEYQLYEGSLIELITEDFCEDGHSGTKICCTIGQRCTTGDKENDQQDLLDVDYYPLALQISEIPSPMVFPHTWSLFPAKGKDVTNPTYLPNPPPPRWS